MKAIYIVFIEGIKTEEIYRPVIKRNLKNQSS
jgi:hypothetical protein